MRPDFYSINPPDGVTILVLFARDGKKRSCYLKCTCGRNLVADYYQFKHRKSESCFCGGKDDNRQRLDRKIAMKYYKEKLQKYWESKNEPNS